MVGIWTVVPDSFENHLPSVSERYPDVVRCERSASRIRALLRAPPRVRSGSGGGDAAVLHRVQSMPPVVATGG
jgi:hypothetical protein